MLFAGGCLVGVHLAAPLPRFVGRELDEAHIRDARRERQASVGTRRIHDRRMGLLQRLRA